MLEIQDLDLHAPKRNFFVNISSGKALIKNQHKERNYFIPAQ